MDNVLQKITDVKNVIIIILLVVIFYFIYIHYSFQESMISGMWEASEEFCDSAGIDNMYLRIGDKDNGDYKICIIMIEDNKVVKDETLNMSLGFTYPTKKINTVVTLHKDLGIMPTSMECVIDMNNGVMVWKDENTEYGRFQRKFI